MPSTPVAQNVASARTPNESGNRGLTRAPPRGPPNFDLLPKPQPPPGAPTGPRGRAPVVIGQSTPAAGNGNRNPGFGGRGRGGFRGGRGGQHTPVLRPGPVRGPRSTNAAGESFQRMKGNMAREAAEAAKKQ